MRILVVDDHVLFRRGLIFLLQDLAPDLTVDEAGDCTSALARQPHDHDLVLLDLHLPGVASLDALDTMREAFVASGIVVMSGEEDPRLIRATIDRGAAGFIPKSSTPEVMIGALRLVLAGGVYLPPIALNDLARPEASDLAPIERPADLHRILSERQLDVLHRAIKGKPNKIIARELQVSEGTVKAHLSAAFRAIGAHNRTEAVYRAAQLGLGAPTDARP